MQGQSALVLVTGATGYVGGRLIPRLLNAGYPVRVMVRDQERLQGRPWASSVEVVEGDVVHPKTLPVVMSGVEVAYYLVHGVYGGKDGWEREVAAARHFGQAASAAGVRRIIYLGSLGNAIPQLSPYPQAGQTAGQALAEAGVPVTEFRAAVIVGSGSIAFEIVRNMTERVPVMFCPRWVRARVQPIAIRDVLSYLIAALDIEGGPSQTIEIGGADTSTYGDMMAGYARVRGLRRVLVPVPLMALGLSAYWIHWVTPISADIAHPLIAGLRNDAIVRDSSALRIFPEIHPLDYSTALLLAVERTEAGLVETSWSDALATSQKDAPTVSLTVEEGVIIEERRRVVEAPVERTFEIFTGLGGKRGWLYANWTWVLRGMIDRLAGGVGLRRGRRHPDLIHAGDALDFWRVEKVEDNRLLRLRAEMRVPGRAWLEFQAQPQPDGTTNLTQRAFFAPKGVPGLVYWYGLYPIHSLIFSGLIREIARRAEQGSNPARQG